MDLQQWPQLNICSLKLCESLDCMRGQIPKQVYKRRKCVVQVISQLVQKKTSSSAQNMNYSLTEPQQNDDS